MAALNNLNSFLPGGNEQSLNSDNLNINDVLDLLPNSTSWDVLGSDSMNFSMAGSELTAQNLPTTNVSWSSTGMGTGHMASSHQQMSQAKVPNFQGQGQGRRPMPLNIQTRGGLYDKNQSNAAFGMMGQRSPGFSSQRSPGFSARSPAPGGLQRTPSGGNFINFNQGSRPQTPNLMSPPATNSKCDFFCILYFDPLVSSISFVLTGTRLVQHLSALL